MLSIKNLSDARSWLLDYLDHRKIPEVPRVLKENKLEDTIFRACVHDDPAFQTFITVHQDSYPSTPELANDVFTALFSLSPSWNKQALLTDRANVFNRPIIDTLMSSEEYGKLTKLCRDKELPAYHACTAFCDSLYKQLEKIHTDEFRYLSITEILNQQIDALLKQLSAEFLGIVPLTEKTTLKLINRLKSKLQQQINLRVKLEQGKTCLSVNIKELVSSAAEVAVEAAQATSNILLSWGCDDGTMRSDPQNRELLEHIKNSKMLSDVSKLLGKYREIMNQRRKNSYQYGYGDKYDLTHGNDLGNCLSSEFALLGHPDTQILFLRKYQRKQLALYRKRRPITKGEGDIIVLIDESGSTSEVQSWSKALAFALLDIAAKGNRRFALIHFASREEIKTDIFDPGKYTPEDVIASAEHFFDGGTDFEAPLSEALRLMDNGFEDADMTIITDGDCRISEEFADMFEEQKQLRRMTLTGILLDAGRSCGESLLPFCDTVYHAREFAKDEIALKMMERSI